jgi:hypothetical protein
MRGGFQALVSGPSSGGGGFGTGSYHAQSNSSGNSTITPTSGRHSEIVTFSGSARTSILDIAVASGQSAGDQVFVTGILPSTAGIVVQITNASTGGTLLWQYTSNGSTLSFYFQGVFDGTNWNCQAAFAPAYYPPP